MNEPTQQLVDGPQLLEMLFPEKCRPRIGWLLEQRQKRAIPFVRLGRLVFYDPEQVRAAINERHTIKKRP